MTCAGALNLCDKLKAERTGSIFSAHGTFAHTVREFSLDLGIDPDSLIGLRGVVDGFEFVCDDEMADHLQPGIDRVREFVGSMTVEYRVDLSRWMPGQFGTLDLGIAGDDEIVISDLKYGMGVPVSPVRNEQQMIYALGFWDNVARHITDTKKFRIIIDQPRISSGGGEWTTTLDELLAFGEDVKRKAALTKDPDAPRCASARACHWCEAAKVAGACPEHEAFVLSIVGQSFEDLDEMAAMGLPPALPAPIALTPERISFIVQNRHVFERWLDRLHDDALEAAIRGERIPGLKAVPGRAAPRKYIDKAAAESLVLDKIGARGFKQVLKTPTQIEKEFGKDVYAEISDVVTRGETKPQLVHESDAREALTPTVEKFDLLD